ncbi:hypothetical protein NLY43_26935 [Mesorhizobium sp. C416B]|uniref:hypothetical protein n=1 Tax=unclassified Mesorhizobium TaxID=325217 RepID=UPI0003CF1E6D|nr:MULTISPECIES: hypothetical protein [unclassified Mesorhizobium]ESX49464.1 hypothetical protein X762_13770 [Mesorhizobium sp. LSHC426A00]ESX56217.1 hypothetical protein X761_11185 [Mesorhizobium sp. LSHC424B00]ESX73063.1 hypothetical protein X758_10520 [Mesorhizobium sp. LSHC416B00]WJI62191.1 hypothetical protein NLY43_26935 [Mesorhizobium sp. C416B]
MSDIASYVAKIVALNGGSIVGKTRLQKSAYFLEELGVGNDSIFEYYYYGPYSEEISIGTDDAKALGYLNIDWKSTKDGAKYAVFMSDLKIEEEGADGKRKAILDTLSRYDSISIELAATADFLSKNGFENDPWRETIKRKEDKSTQERIQKAKKLLGELEKV